MGFRNKGRSGKNKTQEEVDALLDTWEIKQ
jgi:hypothetical protein